MNTSSKSSDNEIDPKTLIGGTGSFGGAGVNGDTNVPGLPGGPILGESEETNAQSIVTGIQSSFDDQILSIMIGGTGGLGNIPATVEEAKEKQLAPKDILKEVRSGEFSSLSTEEKVKALLSTDNKFKPIFANAQSQMAAIALVTGEMANIIKKEVCCSRGGSAAWTSFRRKYLDPYINPNTLKVRMDIASIRNIEKYLSLGIDRLGKLALLINDNYLNKEDDPINLVLQKIDKKLSIDMPGDEFKINCDAAIARHRLERNNIEVPFETIRAFCECGLKIEKIDITEMLFRKKNGSNPTEYLVALMNDPENRQDLLTHKKTEAEALGRKRGMEGAAAPIKDINSEVQRLREVVTDVLKLDQITTPVEVSRIDSLITVLQELKVKASPKSEAEAA